MILHDYSGLQIANLMIQVEGNKDDLNEVSEDLLRHMILTNLKNQHLKFKKRYGELILCMDADHYWRRDAFPEYKWKRKEDKKNSELDWDRLYVMLNKIQEEIKANLPYKVIHVDGAEADDIIGVLAKKLHIIEPMLIISNDKDFFQLQRYKNIKQYRPATEKIYVEDEPIAYLREHIIRGDKGDGIPNFKSPDNSFVIGKRQKSIMTKDMLMYLEQTPEEFCEDEEQLKNFKRNEKLVDLAQTPQDIQRAIYEQYENYKVNKRSKVVNYFMQKGLKQLLESVNDF